MASLSFLVFVLASLVGQVTSSSGQPIVSLGYGTFQGNTTGGVTEFLGIPYAKPPLGLLRFAPPQAPVKTSGVRQATTFGAACPQQLSVIPNVLPFQISAGPGPASVSEDCLFINVVVPANISSTTKLPVLFWIYGGGFGTGDGSANPGDAIVQRSITLGEPIIYVSSNYRVNAFGFLASKEAKAAGSTNSGILDQRFAMQWVQSHISAFGGDPSKVTIWGESAGALSVGLHLVIDHGNPGGLFRGAIMESGGPYTLRDVSAAQPYYDQLVEETGCSKSKDTLTCLREAPYNTLLAAINNTPSVFNFTSLNLAWQPRIDGSLFTENPQKSVALGQYARVPLLAGDCDDEGTVFSLSSVNITTNAEFLGYLKSNYYPTASPSEMAVIGQVYPDDPTQGAPFLTGDENELTPQFKRISAFQGDYIFQGPRRFLYQFASRTQPTWGYLFKRFKATPFLGSFHGSDISEFYTTPGVTDPGSPPDFIGTDALVNFVTSLDPNAKRNLPANISYLSTVTWAQYGSNPFAPPLLTFNDPEPTFNFTTDTYRQAAMAAITALSLKEFP
ncbi:sterol esterase [Auriscalpium vulgare]|uniref:Sterol esterase n=1 Tax=Auriscalpium vulgare TaxID=40419 RepID=A0ACB8R6R9_9AGAM|nr:sterol esterase [Auriscalpium vulgare]